MSLITASELASTDYEWLNEYFDNCTPEFAHDNGRTVFTYFRDGFISGCCQLELSLLLRVNDINRTAVVYCKSYDTQGDTVFVEYDYEKAVEIEKTFSGIIPVADRRRFINRGSKKRVAVRIDGYDSYIMFAAGDVISWHYSIPDEWQIYRDCVKSVYSCIDAKYPIILKERFYTEYETQLYAHGCTYKFLIVKHYQRLFFIHHWVKCCDEYKQKPIIKLYYSRKMLVLSLSLNEREKLEDDLHDNLFIKLSDYEIETIEVCKSDYNWSVLNHYSYKK